MATRDATESCDKDRVLWWNVVNVSVVNDIMNNNNNIENNYKKTATSITSRITMSKKI